MIVRALTVVLGGLLRLLTREGRELRTREAFTPPGAPVRGNL